MFFITYSSKLLVDGFVFEAEAGVRLRSRFHSSEIWLFIRALSNLCEMT